MESSHNNNKSRKTARPVLTSPSTAANSEGSRLKQLKVLKMLYQVLPKQQEKEQESSEYYPKSSIDVNRHFQQCFIKTPSIYQKNQSR
jgi:hypothetical protein